MFGQVLKWECEIVVVVLVLLLLLLFHWIRGQFVHENVFKLSVGEVIRAWLLTIYYIQAPCLLVAHAFLFYHLYHYHTQCLPHNDKHELGIRKGRNETNRQTFIVITNRAFLSFRSWRRELMYLSVKCFTKKVTKLSCRNLYFHHS